MSLAADAYVTHAAFGLRYRSRLPWLPAPWISEDAIPGDVELSLGEATPRLPIDGARGPVIEGTPALCWFRTRTIADYRIEKGCRVHILPKVGAEPLKLANLLFGGVTGVLLIQRGTLALHGCSMETPQGAVLFCGPSGAGKSTLAGLLLERGRRVLDDNIAAMDHRADGIQVQPGLGQLRLTATSHALLGSQPRGPGFAAPTELKYLHRLSPAEFCAEPRPLRHLFVLDRSLSEILQPLRGQDKLRVIRELVFFRQMVAPLGATTRHFHHCVRLAEAIPVSRLGHPPGLSPANWGDLVAKLIDNL